MREALARSDNDFVLYDRPPTRTAGRAGAKRGARKAGLARRLLGLLVRRPGRSFGALVFLGFAAAIVVNAVVLQRSQHPAPLFGADRGELRRDARLPPRQTEMAPALPPSRPAELAPQPTEQAALADAMARATQPSAQGTAPRPLARDAIGDLIRTGEPRAEAQRPVLAAQRALAKLGYGVKPDGLMGAATRTAIERFEKDKGLPVTGELGPRVVKALSAAAGMPIE
ncbi:peptidoglycan-binding domain-containing protein [Chelatococcus sp. SYSU_G07232]|uniref:Peptidoglycan-binding domain-containing protein n=1 Tax=Chelatococcus albus TaxID=3047466 RepID=A0ABT7AJ86_9HYPH|nr:peptidoglycan-binding domain-containing protein [Chelatococcus sp. SYSU_G07232]MDJ1159052.1 peptidoglycan-binding domain-containing protein [Chelatococcus sp. SYSU_G07232]